MGSNMNIDKLYEQFPYYVNPFAYVGDENIESMFGAKMDKLICKKKKKKPSYAVYVNDWIVQVILDGHWGTAYHSEPPYGEPPTIYGMAEAFVIAGQQALQKWEEAQEGTQNE
jgi:hypothetical protein